MEESGSISIQKCEGLPPIFRLDNDALGHVFSMNADMEQESEERTPALLTLRSISQVCSDWREITTASPRLWARILDIRLLRQGREEWRTEVIRRTGAALLHIKSVNRLGEGWNPNSEDFLESILNEHWPRIQSLHLQLNINAIDDRWSSIFQRPAPFLEVFKFSWPGWPDQEQNLMATDFSLFSNKAPLLRTLSVANMTQNLTTLSASNLRHLVLHPSLSVADLLSGLGGMPLLERLEAAITKALPLLRDGKIQPSLPRVSLPKLEDIKFKVYHAIDATLSLLTHIKPADRCALYFKGLYYHETPDHESVSLYGDVLSTYSKCYTDLETATNLIATFERDCASFSIRFPSHRHFKFHVYNGAGFHEDTVSTFLSSLKTHRLDNFKMLKLSIEPIEPILSNPYLKKFIFSLAAVETLDTTHQTLGFIQRLQSSCAVLAFPALKAIYLNYIHKTDEVSSIVDFLTTRVAMGIPVDTLTLTMGAGVTANLAALNVFPGLILETTGHQHKISN